MQRNTFCNILFEINVKLSVLVCKYFPMTSEIRFGNVSKSLVENGFHGMIKGIMLQNLLVWNCVSFVVRYHLYWFCSISFFLQSFSITLSQTICIEVIYVLSCFVAFRTALYVMIVANVDVKSLIVSLSHLHCGILVETGILLKT